MMTPQDVLGLVGGGVIAGCVTWFQAEIWPKIRAWHVYRKDRQSVRLSDETSRNDVAAENR